MALDTEYVAQRLQCSRTDKQECLPVVQQLLDLAFFAREHGLVELDRYFHRDPLRFCDPFFKKAVSCLVDIGDYRVVEKVLQNYILSGNYSGHQFLKNMVIMETVLAIHQRVDLDHIFSFLIPSLFGMDCEGEISAMYREYVRTHGFRLSAKDGSPLPPDGPEPAPGEPAPEPLP